MASVPVKVANPTQRILPEAQKINARDDFGVDTQFFIYKMPGDGDCGYHALGVSRSEAAKLLMEHAGEAEIRDLVAPEIERAIANNDVPALLNDPQCVAFHKKREEYNTMKSTLDNIVGRIKAPEGAFAPKEAAEYEIFSRMSADQLVGERSPLSSAAKVNLRPIQEEVRRLREEMKKEYNTRAVFEAYVRHYIAVPEMELHCDPVAGDFSLSTSLDAIAKLKNMTVILWSDLLRTGRLSIMHTYNAGPNAPVRNIQYVPGHYNRLEAQGDVVVYPVSTHAWEKEKETKIKQEKIDDFLANKFTLLEVTEQLRLIAEVEKGNTTVLNQYIATTVSAKTPTSAATPAAMVTTSTTAATAAATTANATKKSTL